MGKAPSKIQVIESHFTESEIKRLEKIFKDLSIDGTISKEEFKNALTFHVNAWSKGAQYSFLERLFDAFDLDGDGRIDFQEFIGGLSTFFKGSPEEKAEYRNGKIESKELLKILKAMYSDYYKTDADERFLQVVNQIYSDYDINQDGTLTLEAFKIMSLKEPIMTDFVEEFLRLPDQIEEKDRRKSLI